MQNEILDYEEKELPIKKKSYRKYYLLVESVIVGSLLCVIIFGLINQGFNREQGALFAKTLLPIMCLFYLITPVVKFLRKESTPKLSLLYFIQNICFVLPIFLLTYFQKMFDIRMFNLLPILISLLLFIIIPHLEIKKYNASKKIHLVIIFIHLSIFFSFIGFIQLGEYLITTSEIIARNLAIFPMSLIVLTIMLFLVFRNKVKYYYLGFYLPRLLFAIVLGLVTIFLAYYLPVRSSIHSIH